MQGQQIKKNTWSNAWGGVFPALMLEMGFLAAPAVAQKGSAAPAPPSV